MKNNRIIFIGTSNNTSARESKPGECSNIVNLERHNSTLRPVSSHNFAGSIADSNRKICYIHTCNGEQHIISIYGTTLYHEGNIANGTWTSINKQLYTLSESMQDICSLGNTLIVTSQHYVTYIAYRNEGYKILDHKPPMPTIRFCEKVIENSGYILPQLEFEGRKEEFSEQDYDFYLNHIMGPLYKHRDKIHQQHAFFEPVLVRYALRLFDGSHILPSPPILVNLHNYTRLLQDYHLTFLYKEETNKTTLQAETIQWGTMGIEYIVDSINLDEWSDIVTGIDIFISKELSLIEDRPIDEHSYYDTNNKQSEYAYQYKIPIQKSAHIEQQVLNESVFYHLTTLNIADITPQKFTLIEHNINPDEIIYQPLLEVDTMSLSTIGAQHSFIYNNRLHLADITQRHYPGYPPTMFCCCNENNGNALIYMRTKITQPNGGIEETVALLTAPNFSMQLSPLISYPDANAFSMEIGIRYNGYDYKKRIALTAVENEDRASYIGPNALYIDVNNWLKEKVTNDNYNNFPTVTSTFVSTQRNKMIVSQSSNPFYFPNELSYYISNGTINGMATATAALSQGQFGEFPLYIFTSEGIWSMQVGTGNICYARCTPLNNEHTGKHSFILPIENAVIYLSGNKISLISGSQCKDLLSLTEIPAGNFNDALARLLPSLSSAGKDITPIINYVKENTTATYNYNKNELILCNNDYPYCWILHLPSGHLYRWEQSIQSIVGCGDMLLAQNSNRMIYNLNDKIGSSGEIQLITKPLQLVPDTYTRLRQIVWRMQASHCSLSVTILAAHEPDGTYKVIHRSRYDGSIKGHLPVRILSAPYKYFRLALSGTVSPDTTIDCADLTYEIVENNKLR